MARKGGGKTRREKEEGNGGRRMSFRAYKYLISGREAEEDERCDVASGGGTSQVLVRQSMQGEGGDRFFR